MHELTITQNILDLVLKQARESGAKRVAKINLVIGEMTGVVDRSVQFYFDLLSRNTPAQGAELNFKMVALQARCRDCARVFDFDENVSQCPHCHGTSVEIISGNELFVESIEVD
jgi:hydrogenase nickel incorporation protein HypA/HybF